MSKQRKVTAEATGSRVIEQSRVRLMCVALFFFLCFMSINVRLIEMMISNPYSGSNKNASNSKTIAEEPEDFEVKATDSRIKRGDIVDRNGEVLATSLITESSFANPREISDPEAAAAKLEKVVGIPRETLLKRLKGDKTFVWIKRHMSPREQQAVNNLGIPGIYFQPEEQRVYPFSNLLSHVVGYTGVDNKGLGGIEGSQDQRLSDEGLNSEPLALSIDVRLQHILRDELQKSMEDFRAIGATGVILDVKTSEVLALSSLPDFDPNRPSKATDDQKFNRAANGVYEMGSTFKSFTMALGLDTKTTTMKGGYDATNPLKYGTFTIADSHPKRRWLTVPEIFAYSSNIGTARMLIDVGAKKQKAFLDKLGMLKPVDIELPERPQPMYPKEWKEISAITIAYGHGISVTPLHLARGIAALVGGGVMRPLTILKDGDKRRSDGERVVSEETSKEVARLLRLVVKHGTGGKADIPGYRVGGKTGTAEKVQAGGTYSKDSNMASFIATFPVDNPAYIVLVMVDEPKGNKASFGFATGGWVAAPAAGRVISRMAPLMGIKPEYDVKQDDAEKYWVDGNRKASAPQQATRDVGGDQRYVRKVAY